MLEKAPQQKNSSSFKDNFSSQATSYATFRPQYPDTLFHYLASECKNRQLAWDAGTGNGQAALKLANTFDQVYATDASASQIQNATPHPKISYAVCNEKVPELKTRSVDLITVAQALHWFDLDVFYAETERVLVRFGLLACWTYDLFKINPEIDFEVNRLYSQILGDYWDHERRFVETGYRSLTFPFRETKAPPFKMKTYWNFDQMLGFLRTWSSVAKYQKKVSSNPVEENEDRLLKVWGERDKKYPVSWKITMRIGRKMH